MKSTVLGFLAAAFLALLPFITTGNLFYGAINAKFFALILVTDLALLLGAYYLYEGRRRILLRGRWFLYTLVLALLAQYTSALLGVFPEHSFWSDIFWSSGVLFLTHVGLLAFILAEFLSERDWTNVRRAIAVSSGVFSALLLVGVNGLGYAGKVLWLDFGEGSISLGNETYAGAYLLLAFIIGLIEFFRTPRGTKWRVALGGSLGLMALSPILFNTGLIFGRVPLGDLLHSPAAVLGDTRASSAALFALMVFLAGYVLLQRFSSKDWRTSALLVWSGTLLAGVVLFVGLLFVPGSAVQNTYIEQSSAARIYVWNSTFKAFLDRPLFGWGPENLNLAIERHFDSRLFEDRNYGEIWFERAHNVFLDTLASVGVIGALTALLVLLAYLVVVYRARKNGRIGEIEAVLLWALPALHVLQMQTGFDTIGSYVLLGVVGGYVLSLERPDMRRAASTQEWMAARALAVSCVVLALASGGFVLLAEYNRQTALLTTFTGRNPAEQRAAIDVSLARRSSFESLRLSSASFIQGSLASVVEQPSPEKTNIILSFTDVYEKHYQAYLAAQPDHYRAHLNYAYLLLVETTLGRNRVADAKKVLTSAYALSPGNPLTYTLDALVELYSGNLKESERLIHEAVAINPDIEFTQHAASYFAEQYAQFPNITALKITNL